MSATSSPMRTHFIHLDMLRGLAALAVVVGHIRGFLYVDFPQVAAPNIGHVLLYLVTGLGHEAVIAFFALSGFLVGGKALADMMDGRWSWPRYMVARLARLWTVVVPALLLTLAWDTIGRGFGGTAGYEGAYVAALASGPTAAEPADSSLMTLLANVLFLQTVLAPTYGSNGPLWSLAYEFWYYVMVPLLAASMLVPAPLWQRACLAAAGLALVVALPRSIVVLGLVWVAGALGYWLLAVPRLRAVIQRPLVAVAATALAIVLIASLILASKAGRLPLTAPWPDLALGVAFAALLPGLAALPPVGGLYARIATGLSDISYTLYATHFPMLAAIWFVGFAPLQWQPGFGSLAIGLAAVTLALGYAWLLWWCFEARTPHVRKAALVSLGLTPPRAIATGVTSP